MKVIKVFDGTEEHFVLKCKDDDVKHAIEGFRSFDTFTVKDAEGGFTCFRSEKITAIMVIEM